MDDEGEFLAATLAHAEVIHALAARLTAPGQDAADLVQETYLRAFAAWERRRPEDVGAWLATICLNTGRTQLRRHLRRVAVETASEPPDLPGAADTAHDALERIRAARVRAAMATLPEPQRIAVTLVDLCGFTSGQAATITGAPRGTILARVHRARRKLALLLDGEHEHQPPVTAVEVRDQTPT